MTPSTCSRISATLSLVTPEPTSSGRLVAFATSSISSRVAALPVRCPVAMTASASKNARSRVSSATLRSATIAWLPCFTWLSAKTLTPSARKRRAVAQRLAGAPLDEAFVRHVGVRPLVHADERCPRGGRDGEGRDRRVREHVHADGHSRGAQDPVGGDGEEACRLGSDVLGLQERHVAVVLDDQPVHAALDIGSGIRQAALVDRLHGRPVVARRAREGRTVNDARSAPSRRTACAPGRRGFEVMECMGGAKWGRRMSAVVVGNATVDETYALDALPRAGESLVGAPAGVDLGGKGANAAVVLARCGVPTRLVACVGDDARGAFVRTRLRSEPVEAALLTSPGAGDRPVHRLRDAGRGERDRVDGRHDARPGAAARAARARRCGVRCNGRAAGQPDGDDDVRGRGGGARARSPDRAESGRP